MKLVSVLSYAIIAIVVLNPTSEMFGQAPASGQSLGETMTFVTEFMASHGCSTATYQLPNGKINNVSYCVNIAKVDGCSISVSVKNSHTDSRFNSEYPQSFDLSALDPDSVKSGDIVTNPDILASVTANGPAVLASSSLGHVALRWPVDTADNASHIINALSHAIRLCGGKKAAF